MTDDEHLVLSNRCLAVFVDDSGHEELLPDHLVYCLGGCAVLGRDLDRVIRQPWRAIRKVVTGSPDTPLHAYDFPAIATAEGMTAVVEFFRVHPFFRFGAILSVNTQFLDDMALLRSMDDDKELPPSRISEIVRRTLPTMKMVLQSRINEIVGRTLCKEVAVIFESSDRADPLIKAAFRDFEVHRGPKRIPSECYFMRKSTADPALEVADFVMNAVGGQGRQNLKDRMKYRRDFQAVFHSVDCNLTSFIDVAGVTKND
jgi:hypothetical protein